MVDNSMFFDLLMGTLQGSILGLMLYAIYVSPLSDLAFLLLMIIISEDSTPTLTTSLQMSKTH
jgi:hypothetical protein